VHTSEGCAVQTCAIGKYYHNRVLLILLLVVHLCATQHSSNHQHSTMILLLLVCFNAVAYTHCTNSTLLRTDNYSHACTCFNAITLLLTHATHTLQQQCPSAVHGSNVLSRRLSVPQRFRCLSCRVLLPGWWIR
jgi:hypothetical protein